MTLVDLKTKQKRDGNSLRFAVLAFSFIGTLGLIWATGGSASPLWSLHVLPLLVATLFGRFWPILLTGLGLAAANLVLFEATPEAVAALPAGATDAATTLSLALLIAVLSISVGSWRSRRMAEAEERLEQLAYKDELTGLGNYRQFRDRLTEETQRAGRYRRPLSLILLDLDGFKTLNDRYGHQAGNLVLEKVGETIRNAVRSSDIASRYGGDEFAVICPETTAIEAAQLAERIRSLIADVDVAGPEYQITLTAGVAALGRGERGPGTLIDSADSALYRGKSLGGNRVVLNRPESAVVRKRNTARL